MLAAPKLKFDIFTLSENPKTTFIGRSSEEYKFCQKSEN